MDLHVSCLGTWLPKYPVIRVCVCVSLTQSAVLRSQYLPTPERHATNLGETTVLYYLLPASLVLLPRDSIPWHRPPLPRAPVSGSVLLQISASLLSSQKMMSFDTHFGFEPPPPREELETLALADDPHPLSAVSATADGGGDPLLHPPSTSPLHSPRSPSSSHPFLDPPSYADAVFSPFESQNGGSGHISPRNGGHSLRSLRFADSEYVKITVSDPQKEQESANSLVPGGSTYVTYLITSRARDPDGGAPDFAVRRRFRDVVTLADRLAESYRGFFIPPRPDKGVVESQVMQKQEFVEQRRAALEKYLWRLATHPVIGRSDELSAFLGAPGKLPLPGSSAMGSRILHEAVQLPRQLLGESAVGSVVPQDVVQQAKGGRDLLRIFKELKQSVANDWGGVKPLVVEEDKEFLERKEKIQELEQQLTNASQQAETLVKAQQDIGETMGELGLSFFKLAKFETEEAIHNSQRMRVAEIKCFATAAVKASRFCRESNAQTVKHLDTLHEYLGLMLAAHSAFSDRSSALLTVQTLMSDLSSLQTKIEKLEAASSRTFGGDKTRIRKIEELKETIRTTEDSKSCALKEYERIKENNRSELERLDRDRHNDFLGMLKGFVINQVGYAEKIASVWTLVVEETSRFATESN